MPDYGPPGEPHPGRPQEPWPGRQPPDPHEQPTQEWVRPESWDDVGQQLYRQPEGGYPPYPQPRYGDHQGGYVPSQPYEPSHRAAGPESTMPLPGSVPTGRRGGSSSRLPVLVLIVVLALLVLGGGGTALYLLGQREPSAGRPSARASDPQPSAAGPSGTRGTTTHSSASTPAPQSSTDARFVKVGQCVKNEGGSSRPRLVITPCTRKTYQVLARFDGATTGEDDAKAKCGNVAGYTDWYFFNSELDVLDFVLCLKLH
jgi:hypothetical protein